MASKPNPSEPTPSEPASGNASAKDGPPVLDTQASGLADVLILGGSHAGLSAALTLARQQIDSIVFDSNEPRNKWRTPIHIVSTWDGRSPDGVRKASRRELKRTGLARFVQTRIETIKTLEGNQTLFEVGDAQGRTWRGRKLLVATGVEFTYPPIKLVGRHPSLHCLFTRGLEFKGSRSAGLLAEGLTGSPFHAAMLVEDAQKFVHTVTTVHVDDREITQLSKASAGSGIKIHLDNDEVKAESCLVRQPATQASPEIVRQLGLECNERGDIIGKMPFQHTNVPGVFAAGDSASPFKVVPNALFQGSNPGAGIARELPRRVTGHEADRIKEQMII
ncbi:FAD/NAD(P)-binding domain-containing protein [Thozetella sp. PMI_491]|nr:FAD/NAD(P)-binding domain-containing protein [Thozetella sp. PMI_491]